MRAVTDCALNRKAIRHYMAEPADWNMERRIRLVAIDPDGGTIEILED